MSAVGNAYALAETINGYYKTDCIRTTVFHPGPLWASTDIVDQYRAVLGCHRRPIEEACRVLGEEEIHGVWDGVVRGQTGVANSPSGWPAKYRDCHAVRDDERAGQVLLRLTSSGRCDSAAPSVSGIDVRRSGRVLLRRDQDPRLR